MLLSTGSSFSLLSSLGLPPFSRLPTLVLLRRRFYWRSGENTVSVANYMAFYTFERAGKRPKRGTRTDCLLISFLIFNTFKVAVSLARVISSEAVSRKQIIRSFTEAYCIFVFFRKHSFSFKL